MSPPAGRGAGRSVGPGGEAGATQRQLRVAEQMRHLIAEDLMHGEIHDARLEGAHVTIAEVRVSRDLKHAVVYATELGRDLRAETLAALTDAAPRLGGRLARRMHLKYAPKLRFVADESFAEAERVQRLIDQGLAELGRGARSDEGGEHG